MVVRKANREDPDQTASEQSDLRLPFLSWLLWQAASVQNYRTFIVVQLVAGWIANLTSTDCSNRSGEFNPSPLL